MTEDFKHPEEGQDNGQNGAPDEDASSSENETDLQHQFDECVKLRDEYLDNWKRAQAAAANDRQRLEKMLEQKQNDMLVRFLRDVLPVFDSYHAYAQTSEAGSSTAVAKGIEGMYNQLKRVFESADGSTIDPMGELFDPMFHEAVKTVPVEKDKDGVVCEVMRLGYTLKGTVLRPAQVVVGECDKQ